MLTIHGTADQLVPFAQATALAARYKHAAVRHVLLPVEGAGHGFPEQETRDALESSFLFLDSYLSKQVY